MDRHSGYSSDELMRFIGRAYRHYAIDGTTDRLLNNPLILPHLQNPNFAAGTEGIAGEPVTRTKSPLRCDRPTPILALGNAKSSWWLTPS